MGTTMGKFQKLSRSGVSLGPGSKQLSSDLKFRSEENIYSTTSISHSLASNSTGGSDTSRTHCYSIRLNPKKIGPLQFCLPVFLGTHRKPKQKLFFNSREGFFR